MTEPYVRVDVWSLAEDDPIITFYAAAVNAMKQKSATDPTSWTYQAAVHGIDPTKPPPSGVSQFLPQWNQCQHYSWYFLPWHRMFVYYFEQIVRTYVTAQGGPATWALPYWNYDGGGDSNQLPIPFRNQYNADGTTLNPLWADRGSLWVPSLGLLQHVNDGAPLPALDISATNAFDQTTFTGTGAFGGSETGKPAQFFLQNGEEIPGALEQTPHDDVHNDAGGLMTSPYTAARDPIFWLHHANIDRLWALWAQQNSNPADPIWLNQNFLVDGNSAFAAANGNLIQGSSALTCAQVLDTVGQLGYTYDDQLPPGAPPPPPPPEEEVKAVNWPSPWPERPKAPAGPGPGPGAVRHLVGATDHPIRLVGEPVTVPIMIDQKVTASLRADKHAGEQQHRAFLDIEGIDAERNPGTVYNVFVNLPSDFTDADLKAHHAGNISLFGIEMARRPPGDQHPHTMRISLDITRLLDRLALDGTWTDGNRLEVTLRPSTLGVPRGQEHLARALAATAHPDLPITIGRISVHYA
jgi:tyrosinase